MPNYTYFFDPMNPNIQVVANTSYAFQQQGFTPDYIWMILAVFTMALAVIAIAWKLREPDGSVTPQKPMFAMLASLVSFYTAWASLAIERVDGQGVAAQVLADPPNNIQYVYAVAQHSVVQSASLAIFFTVIGLLMIVVFVHAILQKEMIQPSKDMETETGAGHE